MGYNFEACTHVGCRITQNNIDVQSSRFAHIKHEKEKVVKIFFHMLMIRDDMVDVKIQHKQLLIIVKES